MFRLLFAVLVVLGGSSAKLPSSNRTLRTVCEAVDCELKPKCPFDYKLVNRCPSCKCYNPCHTLGKSLGCGEDSRCYVDQVDGVFVTRCGLLKTFENRTMCDEPKMVGACKAVIPRFYYASDSGECTRFNYGGCGGNGNNFKTEDECIKTCIY